MRVPHVVVFKIPLFLFSGFLEWMGCIWSLFPRKQGAVGRMQKTRISRFECFKAWSIFPSMVRGRGWTSTKVGQV